ncbi:MAG: ccp 3 [Planctomycetaceae bacterium]|nr:ccp 3 [Planctomycetaceae bacterium]
MLTALRSAAMVALLALWCLPANAGSSNSLLDISADGRWMAAANRDNGSVTIVDLKSNQTVHEIPVGHHPEGVTFLGDTTNFAVTVYGDDQVVFCDGITGKVTGRTEVFDEPYGIVSSIDGSKVYVTLEYPAQVVEINTADRKITRTFGNGQNEVQDDAIAPPFLRGIALSAKENRLYVTEYLTCVVRAISLVDGQEVDRWVANSSDNLARQITLHPTRAKAYMPHIRSRVNVNRGEGSVVPFVSVLSTTAGEGRRRTTMPMDAFNSIFVVANPWETAISPDGKTLCAVFAGTDDMYVCNVVDDDYRELIFRRVVKLGHNPRAVRFSPDGSKFYVYNTLDFEVVGFDADSLRQVSKVEVCKNPLGEEKLLGKILFYTALEPMVGRRWISCSSCHPDGDSDGRTWLNPEGLRNTTALYGMAWTHPLHWSADRDETQDFEHTIRGQLMQGRGLIRGAVREALDKPNKGLSKALDALAVYSNAHPVPRSPYAKQGLSDAAKRGKEIFFSSETQCASCHSGPYLTDSKPVQPYMLHDVGTGESDKHEKMGPKYDTPTLLGIYRTAPYLHHGEAKTLKDVLRKNNPQDKHGKTSQLSDSQVDDLVEFLKALPYEDPIPAGKAAQLIEVDR